VKRVKSRQDKILDAAKAPDWFQTVLNNQYNQYDQYGPPCFHIDTDGSFCSRAQHWDGHRTNHVFVSLFDILEEAMGRREL
jgi:hypothetical protein